MCWTVLFLLHSFEVLICKRSQNFFYLKHYKQLHVWLKACYWLLIYGIPERKQSTRPLSYTPPVSETVCHQPFELLILLQTWHWEGWKGAGEGQKDFNAKAPKPNCSFLPTQGVHQKRPSLKQSRGRKGEVEFCVLKSISSQFYMSLYYRSGLKPSYFCINRDETNLFQHLLHKIVVQFHRNTLRWTISTAHLIRETYDNYEETQFSV